MTRSARWYFCSAEHADEFVLPPPEQTPETEPGLRSRGEPQADSGSREAIGEEEPAHESGPHEAGEKWPPATYEPSASRDPDPLIEVAPQSQAPERTAGPKSETSRTASDFGAPLTWAPVGLTLLGALLSLAEEQDPWPAVAASVILGVSTFWGTRVVTSWERQLAPEKRVHEQRLRGQAERANSEQSLVSPEELRPGEEIVVRAGQFVPADGTVSVGAGAVRGLGGSPEKVQQGSRICAGTLVTSGSLQIICTKTGKDRSFAPLLEPRFGEISRNVAPAKLARLIATVLGPLAAVVGGALLYGLGAPAGVVLAAGGMIWGTLAHPLSKRHPALLSERWLLAAAREGIAFSHESLVNEAGQVTVAVFCARGTVLHGEPEVAEVHPLRGCSEAEVLSLAGGAESVVHHPVATAILRAAQNQGVSLDTARSHNSIPGMGVLCTSSKGETLVLGSRELLLRERISIAMAEETLRLLESRGLTALMLARDDHLIGVLALQDSLRTGAKAAIQLLLDESIEPVLLSGDSRTTTVAVAQALSVEHVRPEIPTAGRASEILNLHHAGAHVAVIGTTPRDDAALSAAQVPIVLEGASVSWRDAKNRHERGAALASRRVLSAPYALIAARRIRSGGLLSVAVTFLPSSLAILASSALLSPLYLPPILGLFGAIVAERLLQRRASEADSLGSS